MWSADSCLPVLALLLPSINPVPGDPSAPAPCAVLLPAHSYRDPGTPPGGPPGQDLEPAQGQHWPGAFLGVGRLDLTSCVCWVALWLQSDHDCCFRCCSAVEDERISDGPLPSPALCSPTSTRLFGGIRRGHKHSPTRRLQLLFAPPVPASGPLY